MIQRWCCPPPLFVIVANLLVDIAYAALAPRVRYG
jgi:ABC-type dipeptide/oligopeptide/nickel transport system permease component